MDVLREMLLPRLTGLRKSGAGYEAKCPAHDDGRASLSVSTGKEHPVVLHCHAGCDRDAVLEALGLKWTDLCQPRDEKADEGEWTPRGPAVAIYDYVDEAGTLLFQVCRTADKQFPQRKPDLSKKTGWTWKLGEVRRVPYRLPRLLEAMDAGQELWIVEGEKDVQSLERVGKVATCCPGGAGKWRDEFNGFFVECDVTIVADRDEPGEKHARQVAAALEGIAASVRIVEAVTGKDAADHLNAGHSVDEFVVTRQVQGGEAKLDLAPDLWQFISVDDEQQDWVVPGLLERGDRLVWTGFEGLGKSMFIRQLAVTVAAGLDPFLFAETEPKRVLLIDCENSERQSRRKFRPLAAASIRVRRRVPDGGLRLIHRPEGMDLTKADDRAWLLERVTAHQPDLLMVGPFYRLHAANINEETAARTTVAALDAARTAVDCALVVEAHAGHGEHGKNRSVRPLGSSLLLRWPEFGYGIAPADKPHGDRSCGEVHPAKPCRATHVEVRPWRGDRDERDWPGQLEYGELWPWTVPSLTSSGPQYQSWHEREDRDERHLSVVEGAS
jgi:5S rRNA maturation endonuclease (ribonuclease M5)